MVCDALPRLKTTPNLKTGPPEAKYVLELLGNVPIHETIVWHKQSCFTSIFIFPGSICLAFPVPVSNKLCKKPENQRTGICREYQRKLNWLYELRKQVPPPHPHPALVSLRLTAWARSHQKPFSKLLFMPLDGDFKAAQAAIGGVCFEGVFVREAPVLHVGSDFICWVTSRKTPNATSYPDLMLTSKLRAAARPRDHPVTDPREFNPLGLRHLSA